LIDEAMRKLRLDKPMFVEDPGALAVASET